ncbi:MAG: PEP/pyruvate-binding domain-containing protein, partial [Actinobacteria bacterium]|nr:PEP/pyruvate-binding domain-containing protein [Actinomycetota bacterium]
MAHVVSLDDGRAIDAALVGGKAAALATARRRGLQTLDGAVLTTAFVAEVDRGTAIGAHPATREVFTLMAGASRALVARSSSPLEDTAGSSMAGQFESVIGVEGVEEFVAAVSTVLASRSRAGAADAPIAVLVQPLLVPRLAGVLFGVDPVSGRSDRRVITAVAGGPEALVSGAVDGSRTVIDAGGTVVEHDQRDGPSLPPVVIRRLGSLATSAADIFAGPQDIEWAIDGGDRLWLLQSRPVTTEIRGVPAGPIFGPGPVAETFPEQLSTLEADLWVPPLRDAIRDALLLAGAATADQIARSPVVAVIDGFVAVDLQLTGEIRMPAGLFQKLNPVPAARRLHAAWRVGRLRSALDGLAEDLLDRVDADLEAVPNVEELTSRQVVALITRAREMLKSLHAHEVLIGLLTDRGESRMTSASVALRVLAEARQDGVADADIKTRSPVVLALTAPRVAADTDLPPSAATPDIAQGGQRSSDAAILREALRLRARWVQELTGRAAWLLGVRLTAAGAIGQPGHVRSLSLDEVEAVVTYRAVPVGALLSAVEEPPSRPLPACFQISDLGR